MNSVSTVLRIVGYAVFLAAIVALPSAAQDDIDSIEALQKAIEEIAKRKKIPAVSYTLVDESGIQLMGSYGLANIEKKQPATNASLYRIGSTSKMFVALAVLKLVEEGKLSLDDSVAKLVPDIEFSNQWESTNPVKVVHLLEHTTGWDDPHLVEYAHNDPRPASLKEGLDFHPHSRESRWVPGTRMAYCNSGSGVAAYIVEKITGQKFEDYIQREFFNPVGMNTATYFWDETVRENGVTLYKKNAKPEHYWHILFRPAGSINASIDDMAQLLALFIGRGEIAGKRLVSENAIARMETPSDHLGAQQGLELGYGLHNYSSNFESWHYREHNGSVNNGLSAFAYLPQIKAGYAVLINSGNVAAQQEIVNLIRRYQTRNLDAPFVEKERELSDAQRALKGHYVAINPRSKISWPLMRLYSIFTVDFEDDKMRIRPLLDTWTAYHYPVSETLFKSDYTGAMHVAVVEDPLAGPVLHMESAVLKPIAGFWVYFRLIFVALWMLMTLSSFVYFMVWGMLKLHEHQFANIPWQVHTWPLLTSTSVVLLLLSFALSSNNALALLSKPTTSSVAIMLLSISFVVFSVLSFIRLVRERNYAMSKLLYFYFVFTTALHLGVVVYMLRFNLVAYVTWS